MARRLGVLYKIETGVFATVRGFARSTGLSGKMVNIAIIKGTDTLFTPENLPTHFTDPREGKNSVVKFLRDGLIAPLSEFPDAVLDRYRLRGFDYVTIDFRDPSYFKAEPELVW